MALLNTDDLINMAMQFFIANASDSDNLYIYKNTGIRENALTVENLKIGFPQTTLSTNNVKDTFLGSQRIDNIHGGSPLTQTLAFSGTTTETATSTTTNSISTGVETSMTATAEVSIPLIGEGSATATTKFSANYSFSDAETKTKSKTQNWSATESVSVLPGQSSIISFYVTEANFDIPVTYECDLGGYAKGRFYKHTGGSGPDGYTVDFSPEYVAYAVSQLKGLNFNGTHYSGDGHLMGGLGITSYISQSTYDADGNLINNSKVDPSKSIMPHNINLLPVIRSDK